MEKKEKTSKFKTIVMERPKPEDRSKDEAERKDKTIVIRLPHISLAGLKPQKKQHSKDSVESKPADDSFVANVRFSDPILKATDLSKESVWHKDLLNNIATGLLLLSFAAIYCMMIDEPILIAFACPALIVFTALAMLDSLNRTNIKYIACGVIAVLLLATLVIFRSNIGSGLAYLMDEFYDVAEDAQAYIYDRFPGGDEATDMDCRVGVMWVSTLMGMLMALVPAGMRRIAGMLLTAVMMLALAYYGLLPETICAAAMLMALLLTISRDNIFASIPLLLITALLFGAITLIDLGESYGISRMDENIRDRIAFRSALIESDTPDTEDTYDSESSADQASESDGSSIMEENASYLFIGLGVLLAAAIGAAIYFLIKRFRQRRAAVRKGIDSADPREAVTAMFPYSVRWLKASGIESREAPFSEMTDDIRRVYETVYAGKFSDMYSLWREAAYSDHDISEADRLAMDRFTKETVALVSEKWNTLQRLRMIYKHAL